MQQSSNPGVKWGFISGIVLILLNVVAWKAGNDVLFSMWNNLTQLLLFIILGALAGRELKKSYGGYIGFKAVLKPVFTTFVIGWLLSAIFQFVLYKYLEPGLPEALKAYTLANTEHFMRWGKAPQDEITKQIDSIKTTDFSVNFTKSFLLYLKHIIFFFGVAVVVSLILRKKAPDQQHS
ncbi:DUF4199 domain-containing protein [Chitinophaga sp. G-6-1-13]|uniref:DUF4199 domain-containing protein n=1 Tax=Chitinophaga fulva TaxID=2728842 RepID=A0A848GJB3_9BACT|nr:DUF4199 domain-containing protein [Chitinophaga fulva]NML38356.1 DUF4199 domain-containing protein [Chitinophaga fulva]